MREMNTILYYSVLKYIPSVIRMESINVGIVVHYPSKNISHFYKTKNTNRIRAFDDEYNPTFFRMVMESLEYELNFGNLEVNTLNLETEDEKKRFSDIKDKDFLSNRISYLANEFRFSSIQSLVTSDAAVKKDIENLKEMYLYYDKPKNKRITKQKVQSLLAKQIKSYKLSNVVKTPTFKDSFGETIKFDYKINDDTLLRAMTFDYSKKSSLVKELKLILYDLQEIKYSDISKIYLIRNDNLEEKNKKEIYNDFENKLKTIKNNKVSLFPLSDLEQTLDKKTKI